MGWPACAAYAKGLDAIETGGGTGAEGVFRVAVGVNQVLARHAIVDFSGLTTPLPLDARRLLETVPKLPEPMPRGGFQLPDFVSRHRSPPCAACRCRPSRMEILS